MRYFGINQIVGDAGEHNAAARLMQDGVFMAVLVGGKMKAYDILIQIADDDAYPYFALVQIKSTKPAQFTKRKHKIITPVPSDNYRDLLSLPLPTYVGGMDLDHEELYIAPAYYKSASGYTHSIPTTYKLSLNNIAQTKKALKDLRADIIQYWDAIGIQNYKINYTSLL